jgi:16S rRNA C967 or C1407 C5-methylase (RsmB/RsmF family)
MIELQRTILKAGLSLLKPGGVLVFATCSLEEEENQAQVTWAQKQLGVQLLAMEATLPTGQPGEPAAHYRDASFAAVLVKAR